MNPIVIEEDDNLNPLMNKGNLYGPIFIYKLVDNI